MEKIVGWVSEKGFTLSKFVMEKPAHYLVAVGSTVPVTWLLSEFAPKPNTAAGKVIRGTAAAAISAFLLVLPASLPKHKGTTMVTAVTSGLLTLSTLKVLCWPDPQPSQRHSSKGARQLGKSLASTTAELLWFLLPLRWVPAEERPRLVERLGLLLKGGLLALGKALLYPLFQAALYRLSTAPADSLPAWKRQLLMPLLWLGSVATGMWQMELLAGAVPLLTDGHFACVPFTDNLLLATSLGDLWSKHYNLMISQFLRGVVYEPARRRQVGPKTALMATFLTSGLLHTYVAACVFRTGVVSSTFFFLFHGLAIVVERAVFPGLNPSYRTPANVAFLVSVLALTFPLYPGLFFPAMPSILDLKGHPKFALSFNNRYFPSLMEGSSRLLE